MAEPIDVLMDRYLNLESLDAQEQLLTVCGSSIDARALPILRRRLEEERASATHYGKQGYARMSEKARQLADTVQLLIGALEAEATHD
jgi:hypothetical protein